MGKIVDTTLDVQRLKRNKKDVLKNGGKAGDEYTRVAYWLSKRSPVAIRTSLSRHRIEKRAERWWMDENGGKKGRVGGCAAG